MSAAATATPPALMFSHFGINCTDVPRLEAFYVRVLGMAISDKGKINDGKTWITFMTRRPREHHQFVLAGGHPAGKPSTIAETGFKAPDLAELRRIEAMLEKEPEASDLVAVDHGISWTLYFRDPEGVRTSVSVETGLYAPQPKAWPLDLSQSDEAIRRETERRCRAEAGFMPRSDWRALKDREFRADGRLTGEAPATGNPAPDFEPPEYPGRILLRTAGGAAPPRIAMSHAGFKVHDMAGVTKFYTDVLGYAVTGRGRMPPIGAEPARDYVYLSRDPGEHHQVVLVSGRDLSVPSSVNQLSLRLTSLGELRCMETALKADPRVTMMRYTCHGNSFSIYFGDPEGNVVELAVESVWYVPAPHGAPLDLSKDDAELIAWAEDHVRHTPGFMMRADWKARARDELIRNGHLEAEGLVRDAAQPVGQGASLPG
jgi:catechol-2,3-dioxygenase